MSLGEWLRFAQLSVLAGWLAVLYLRLAARPAVPPASAGLPERRWRWGATTVLAVVAMLTAAQLAVEVSAA